MLSDILNEKLTDARILFEKEKLYRHIVIKDIDCSKLPPVGTDGKALPKDLIEKVFYPLHQFDETEIQINACPSVYLFELSDESDYKRTIDAFKKAKKEIKHRELPALKNKIPKSKYLYVGKVESEVGGRIVTHLGYYQIKRNHGLQLALWARDLQPSLKLNIHVFRFQIDFKPYVAAMEVVMAKELNPLIGKH